MSSKVTKIFTGFAGLPVCSEPQKELLRYYSKILRGLQGLPEESKYRTTTEKLIKDRKAIVESTTDPVELEKKLNDGQCEEMIEKAKLELKLIDIMKEHKPWEPLDEQPPQNQWKWPLWAVHSFIGLVIIICI